METEPRVTMSKRLWKAYQQVMIQAIGANQNGNMEPLSIAVDALSDLRKAESPEEIQEGDKE